MNKEKRIALACFIGAALGTLLARQYSRHFWWLGILIGGGGAYLIYEFRSVLRAIDAALVTLRQEYRNDFATVRECASAVLSPLVTILLILLETAGSIAYLVLLGYSWFSWIVPLTQHSGGQVRDVHRVELSAVLFLSGLFGAILVVAGIIIKGDTHERFSLRVILRYFKYVNAVSVLFWWLPQGIIWIGRRSPRLFCLAFILPAKLVKETFILIHSEIRLLCMTDAMIGALVGYFCGNALIGGIAGALCGVLNYKLISVRWLKLAKA